MWDGSREQTSTDRAAVRKEILRLSLPIAITSLAQNLYHLIDSLFLSELGEEALSALALVSVPHTILNTLFVGVATGMNVLIAKAMGERLLHLERKAVCSGLLIQTMLAICIAACGGFFTRIYFTVSSTHPLVIEYGCAYLRPVMFLCVLAALQITFERILQAVQVPKLSMISQIAGLSVNLALDPLLIFGAGRFSGLGMQGAVIATLIGQLIAALLAFLFLLRTRRELVARLFQTVSPDRETVRSILSVGVPASAVSILTAVGYYCIHRLLIAHHDTANAVFGVYNRIETFLLLPRQAISIGAITLFSFYMGRRDVRRLRTVFFQTQYVSAAWSLVCMSICLLFSGRLMRLFHLSGETFRMGFACFSIIASTYLPSGIVAIMNAFFQSSGRSRYALAFILIRQLVRIPTAILLFQTGSIDRIWWSWPISEVASDLVMKLLFINHFRRIEQTMQMGTETT